MEGREIVRVRRLWESQGLQVNRLKRVRYGCIFLPSLKQGHFVELGQKEADDLGMQESPSLPVPKMTPQELKDVQRRFDQNEAFESQRGQLGSWPRPQGIHQVAGVNALP